MAREIEVAPAAELVPGWSAVLDGTRSQTRMVSCSRWLAVVGISVPISPMDRSIEEGCLVCPWHGARYDVATGRMTRGPQGFFAKIPGLDAGYLLLTKVLPLRRGVLVEREGTVFVR